MRQVNIHEAKTQLSRLIADGEEVVIARYREPVARLIPLRPPGEFLAPLMENLRFLRSYLSRFRPNC